VRTTASPSTAPRMSSNVWMRVIGWSGSMLRTCRAHGRHERQRITFRRRDDHGHEPPLPKRQLRMRDARPLRCGQAAVLDVSDYADEVRSGSFALLGTHMQRPIGCAPQEFTPRQVPAGCTHKSSSRDGFQLVSETSNWLSLPEDTLMPASWNHVAGWLKQIEALQQASGHAGRTRKPYGSRMEVQVVSISASGVRTVPRPASVGP
jgi:hypothetical protein